MVEDTLDDSSIDLSEPIVTTEDNKPIEFLFDFPENNIIDAVKEAEPAEIKESVEIIAEDYEVVAAPDPVEEIIVPVTYEEPQIEIKTEVEVKPIVTEEVKSKPAPFFSIGKTVMPQSEPQSFNEKIAQVSELYSDRNPHNVSNLSKHMNKNESAFSSLYFHEQTKNKKIANSKFSNLFIN
jgi:hypothetical protein